MQKNILEYLERTSEKFPNKTAFSNGEYDLTFKELSDEAKCIGTNLIKSGYCKEPIAVFADKLPSTVSICLGIIYAGCFYICIDTGAPAERIQKILKKLRPRAIICDGRNIEKAKGFSCDIISYDNVKDFPKSSEALETVRNKQIDTDPIYIVFTSGSTGEPKGVIACHRSVIDYTEALCRDIGFDENCVFGNQAPLYFDAPLKEIMPTLKCGATVYFIPQKLFMFPCELCAFLDKYKINTICWVSSALSLVSSLGALDVSPPRYLKKICFGSEVLPISQYQEWRRTYPRAELYNLYGPTEATGMSAFWHASRELSDDEKIPIGKAFDNTEIILFDGEIYIRGSCVTMGYYCDRGRTESAFVQNPTHARYTDLVYKTGDRAELNEYGELVFLGRGDGQIKHMGHRIELSEIESSALMHKDIDMCCAVHETGKIYLFYTGECSKPSLVGHLSELLPKYMLPEEYVKLKKMPRTDSGKLDRSALKNNIKNT